MTKWKFTDASLRCVSRQLDDGSSQSFFYDSPEITEWIAQGNTPEPPAVEQANVVELEKAGIVFRLAQIDAESVRPLRAKVAGAATTADDAKLKALDTEAVALRVELAGLVP